MKKKKEFKKGSHFTTKNVCLFYVGLISIILSDTLNNNLSLFLMGEHVLKDNVSDSATYLRDQFQHFCVPISHLETRNTRNDKLCSAKIRVH